MKVFISADIEGTAGAASWPETKAGDRLYPYFADEMTEETAAACRGAIAAGSREILVKDAHDSARNINPRKLPEEVKIMRGWTGSPASMMAGLDKSFSASAMIGCHSAVATNGSPLAHTMNTKNDLVTLNGRIASEFLINAYTSAYFGVPVVLVSGDKMLCEDAAQLIPAITTVPVSEGVGNASISLHPAVAQRKIEEKMKQALSGDVSRCLPALPEKFEAFIRFHEHARAYRGSFYPGAKMDGMNGVRFAAKDYFDMLTFFLFVLSDS